MPYTMKSRKHTWTQNRPAVQLNICRDKTVLLYTMKSTKHSRTQSGPGINNEINLTYPDGEQRNEIAKQKKIKNLLTRNLHLHIHYSRKKEEELHTRHTSQ